MRKTNNSRINVNTIITIFLFVLLIVSFLNAFITVNRIVTTTASSTSNNNYDIFISFLENSTDENEQEEQEEEELVGGGDNGNHSNTAPRSISTHKDDDEAPPPLSDDDDDATVKTATNTNKIYGHVHIAKTAGTSLNGMLANKYERVCGHKGYSHDAYQANERAKVKFMTGVRTSVAGNAPYGPDRVNDKDMVDMGFEDCDWISHETDWRFWANNFGHGRFHDMEMELHVPCRDPIDHLMSMCNHQRSLGRIKDVGLSCNDPGDERFTKAIDDCIVHVTDRFDFELGVHFNLKCYKYEKQFSTYMEIMERTLQKRRIISEPYIPRESNAARVPKSECIWNNDSARERANQYLLENFDYYKFCKACIGSDDDLTKDNTVDSQPVKSDIMNEKENPEVLSDVPLVHVLSPYFDRSTKSFSPLNIEQWTSLASIRIARDIYNSSAVQKTMSVILVCAILEADFEALSEVLLQYCDYVKVLHRSTLDEYPNRKGMTALPFIQDIMDAGKSVVNENVRDGYYLIFTNSDICTTRKFYMYVEDNLRTNDYQALIINRMTISLDLLKIPTSSNNEESIIMKHKSIDSIITQAHDILNSGDGLAHPGKDCFIFHSTLLNRLNFGELFLGYPPWGTNLFVLSRIMVDNRSRFGYIASSSNGTFHIGDTMTWKKSNLTDEDDSSWDASDEEDIKWCPILTSSAATGSHIIQQEVNCGKWFRPKTEGSLIPALVQPGYEQIYLDNLKDFKTDDTKMEFEIDKTVADEMLKVKGGQKRLQERLSLMSANKTRAITNTEQESHDKS